VDDRRLPLDNRQWYRRVGRLQKWLLEKAPKMQQTKVFSEQVLQQVFERGGFRLK